ncbi:alkane oxidation protein activator PraB [Paraburkholderia megapolitana]|uniref:alkane oxidation protein activator PraB n=1 Tax=Paraburkholderia megapolitana TaxID=420953 RepID=UPI0038BC0A51
MKSLKMRVLGGAVIVMCAAFSAATFAATIGPAGTSFSATGSIITSTQFYANSGCGITVSGVVASDGSYAQINSAAITDGGVCGLPVLNGLPWKLVATSATTFSIENFGFGYAISGLGECGPSTINGSWNVAANTLTTSNQPLGGKCTVNYLSIKASPALTVSP